MDGWMDRQSVVGKHGSLVLVWQIIEMLKMSAYNVNFHTLSHTAVPDGSCSMTHVLSKIHDYCTWLKLAQCITTSPMIINHLQMYISKIQPYI